MYISAVYIRFYRSFNFDYLRKAHESFVPHPWDVLEFDELKYPFVKVSLEHDITTVVGANESGKSQLLSAIKHALTGKNIARGDFCRYSEFFAVNRSMAFPDFGLEFAGLDTGDREALSQACDIEVDEDLSKFLMFRISGMQPIVYIRMDDWEKHEVVDQARLNNIVPRWFEIDSRVALPESIPLRYLVDGSMGWRSSSRKGRQKFVNQIIDNAPSWFGSTEAITASTPEVLKSYNEATTETGDHVKRRQLAEDLLFKVAKIDRTAFEELLKAVEASRDGFANGIVERMNSALATSLNFPKWWSQDHQFQLRLTLRDQDLVLTIRDRTGTEYSADERSVGLKYFLSYFVQYLAHESPETGVPEVLLMDEPDAFLSGTGQQDLLRVFEDFAHPQNPSRTPCQVVYVTHSPFLIDKNHGDRIRVLEKGEGDEGTRVVKNVARNHYEPLRSAFGSFVAETTFISNCNLMVEGASDQVLLAGISARLRAQVRSGLDSLDLNAVTLVPAGSAEHIPYMVYLARGRDVDRPAVVVLLDSDEAGNKAVGGLKRGPKGKPVINMKFVLQLGSLAGTVESARPDGAREIEDLLPVEVGVAAVKHYAHEFLEPSEASKVSEICAKNVSFDGEMGTHRALERAAAELLPGFHLDKVGFARSVLAVTRDSAQLESELSVLDENFRHLFRRLARLQREAMREIAVEKTGSKIKRLTNSFVLDHPQVAAREHATILLEEIEANLDNSVDSEELRHEILKMRREFMLDEDPAEPVEEFVEFRAALTRLVYREVNEVQEQ